MKRLGVLLAAGLIIGTPAVAQVEVGTKMGATLAFNGGSEFFVGIPGTGAFVVLPSVYTTFFVSRAVMVEPQVLFQWSTATDEANFSGVLQGGYLFTPANKGSLYAAAQGGWLTLGGDLESAIVGGGAGYRMRVGSGAAVRAETMYRRWLCSGCSLNEVNFSLGAGAVF
jgi:hypothetical protein